MLQLDSAKTEGCEPVLERVTCTVNLGCQLNLHQLAQHWYNVELRNDTITVQLRSPDVTARISSQGEMSCYSATSEKDARSGVRQIARRIQKQGFDVQLRHMRVNILAHCTMPFRIRVGGFALCNHILYEPELQGPAEYKIPDLQAHLSIHSNGIIEIIAPTMANVRRAADHIHPLVRAFRIAQGGVAANREAGA